MTPDRNEATQSSASNSYSFPVSRACREALNRRNRAVVLHLRPPLPRTISSPSVLPVLRRRAMCAPGEMKVLTHLSACSLSLYFSLSPCASERRHAGAAPSPFWRPKMGGAATVGSTVPRRIARARAREPATAPSSRAWSAGPLPASADVTVRS